MGATVKSGSFSSKTKKRGLTGAEDGTSDFKKSTIPPAHIREWYNVKKRGEKKKTLDCSGTWQGRK